MDKIQATLAIGQNCNKLPSKDGLDKMFFSSLPRYPLEAAVSPLSNPDRQSQIPMIKLLLEHGANPLQTINIRDEPTERTTILHNLIQKSDKVAPCNLFIHLEGIDIESRNSRENTLSLAACRHCPW